MIAQISDAMNAIYPQITRKSAKITQLTAKNTRMAADIAHLTDAMDDNNTHTTNNITSLTN